MLQETQWVHMFGKADMSITKQLKIVQDLIHGGIGVVIESSCIETLIENIKYTVIEMAVDYKLLINMNLCENDVHLVRVKINKADEESIVFADMIIRADGTEEVVSITMYMYMSVFFKHRTC